MKQPRMPRMYPASSLAGLLFVLIAIWYAAATQSNAAAYVLLFVLTAVFFVSIPHTLLNLVGLKATAQSVKPTFAGDEVSLPVEIVNQSIVARHGIELSLLGCKGRPQRINHVPAGKATRVTLRFAALKRGQELMTKQFSTEPRGSLCFDFAAARFPHIEDQLSQLTLWVIEAERARRAYSLLLPTGEIAPSLGQAHFHRCLRALALFD